MRWCQCRNPPLPHNAWQRGQADGARIPNLPFFYLVYRAWSHWRAISGGKHVQWLVENKLLRLSPSDALDRLYTPAAAGTEPSAREEMLLTQRQVRALSETLGIPALELELERAAWQVERALRKDHARGEQHIGQADGREARRAPAQDKEKKP